MKRLILALVLLNICVSVPAYAEYTARIEGVDYYQDTTTGNDATFGTITTSGTPQGITGDGSGNVAINSNGQDVRVGSTTNYWNFTDSGIMSGAGNASIGDSTFSGVPRIVGGTTCSNTQEGSMCWDTDDNKLCIGSGSAPVCATFD